MSQSSHYHTILITLLLYITLLSIAQSSPLTRRPHPNHFDHHQRRLLNSNVNHHDSLEQNTNEIDCNNFDNLDTYSQYLCINGTVDYWHLPFETADYQCLSENDIQTALAELTSDWTDEEIQYLRNIGMDVELVLDGWSILSFATWIIMKEVFNYNATLMDYYDDAIDIVQYFYPPHVITEVGISTTKNSFIIYFYSRLSP